MVGLLLRLLSKVIELVTGRFLERSSTTCLTSVCSYPDTNQPTTSGHVGAAGANSGYNSVRSFRGHIYLICLSITPSCVLIPSLFTTMAVKNLIILFRIAGMAV